HDALDDTDGDPGRLEVRSLLDVKLDVGSERLAIAASLGRVVGVEAGPGHGIDEPLAVGRAELGDVLDVELARERARAEETRVAPFLVAPRRHHEGQPRARARLVDGLQALEARQDAEGAVEGPATRHRVDVGARHDGGAAVAEPAEDIAGLVHPGAEPGLFHPIEKPRARLFMGGAPAGAW